AGDVKDILLLDVTPLSLGIETLGGINTILIPRNTTIPTSKSQIFSTATDNQPAVDIHVLQGERKMASDNKTLGRFQLTDIPPAPRGVPQIEVTFNIDANGIVNVKAKDLGTNKEQSITIQSGSGLSEEEIQRMIREAEEHAEEDKRRAEEAQLRNDADNLIFQTKKALQDLGNEVDPSEKENVEKRIEELEKALQGNNIADIKDKKAKLEQAAQGIAVKAYQKAQAQAQSQTTDGAKNTSSDDNDTVVDADYEEVD